MSKQSKNTKKRILAATFTKMHLAGNKGPATTTAKHGKVNVFYARGGLTSAGKKARGIKV